MQEIDISVHKTTEQGNVLTLLADLRVEWRGYILIVPAGFQSDGASVPRPFWGLVSPQIDNRTLRGAIVHDYLYRTCPAGWSRKMADDLFYDFIREDGLGWWKAQSAYWSVRVFGGSSWRG